MNNWFFSKTKYRQSQSKKIVFLYFVYEKTVFINIKFTKLYYLNVLINLYSAKLSKDIFSQYYESILVCNKNQLYKNNSYKSEIPIV